MNGLLVVLAGLPLKLRARITGALSEAQVVALAGEEELTQWLGQNKAVALVLHEKVCRRPIRELLAQIRLNFGGLLLVILQSSHGGVELKTMVRSDQVTQFFHDPAPADEMIKVLALELGLSLQPRDREQTGSSLDVVWHESVPRLREWLERLERVLQTSDFDPDNARRAAHYLAGTLGTFGFPQGALLAREAERLLQARGELNLNRLERVVEALRDLTMSAQLARRPCYKAIAICDAGSFFDELEVEARLLQWEVELCEDLDELPAQLARPQVRVVVVDAGAAACKRQPQKLEALLDDPYPTVAISRAGALCPVSTPHCRWLEPPASAYTVMLAVLRTQLAPSLDSPPCILVVDDDQVSLNVVEHALSDVDFHVETLASPLEFWDRLESVQPDLIILDVELPLIGGIDLCRAVRLDDRYARLPIMFLSGYADSRTVMKAFEAGADDYIFKPVVPDELRTRVSNRLERCRQRQRVAPFNGHAYSSLNQLMLRSLREDIPLALALLRRSEADMPSCLRGLRNTLRGEDLVKRLPGEEILVAILGQNSRGLQSRLGASLGRFGLAWFPEEGRELTGLLALARGRTGG